jgi:hypothetical protein
MDMCDQSLYVLFTVLCYDLTTILRSRALHRVLSLAIQDAWCSYMLSRLYRKVKTFRSNLLTTIGMILYIVPASPHYEPRRILHAIAIISKHIFLVILRSFPNGGTTVINQGPMKRKKVPRWQTDWNVVHFGKSFSSEHVLHNDLCSHHGTTMTEHHALQLHHQNMLHKQSQGEHTSGKKCSMKEWKWHTIKAQITRSNHAIMCCW